MSAELAKPKYFHHPKIKIFSKTGRLKDCLRFIFLISNVIYLVFWYLPPCLYLHLNFCRSNCKITNPTVLLLLEKNFCHVKDIITPTTYTFLALSPIWQTKNIDFAKKNIILLPLEASYTFWHILVSNFKPTNFKMHLSKMFIYYTTISTRKVAVWYFSHLQWVKKSTIQV